MDEGLLTVEQVLLLEHLTYLGEDDNKKGADGDVEEVEKIFPGMLDIDVDYGSGNITVREVLEQVHIDELDDTHDYGCYMTGKDWKDIKRAILQDETLCNMKVKQVDGDTEEIGALSAVFVNEETGEAVVAFRGTRPYEWKDNFLAAAKTLLDDAVSSLYQDKSLKWFEGLNLEEAGYSTVTVTGHSKGGNKAKYITILNPIVDRCISFDGEGFSDEFFKKYDRLIGQRQHAITNYNVSNDYVNILLNDVGETYYCKGYDYGNGRVLEAHCPNTFLIYDEQGNACIVLADENASDLRELDKFLNSYLRTLNEEEKMLAMEVVGEIAGSFFSAEKDENGKVEIGLSDVIEIISEKDAWGSMANVAAYAAGYAVLHPAFTGVLKKIIDGYYADTPVGLVCNYFIPYLKMICFNPLYLQGLPTPSELRSIAAAEIRPFNKNTGADLQIQSICHRPLEKNRVFDRNKLAEFGSRGKSLMNMASGVCRSWDNAIFGLKEVMAELPTEVRSAELDSILSEVSTPFYKDDYELMGRRVENTVYKIMEEIPDLDSKAAGELDEITANLDMQMSGIRKLQEEICEKAM